MVVADDDCPRALLRGGVPPTGRPWPDGGSADFLSAPLRADLARCSARHAPTGQKIILDRALYSAILVLLQSWRTAMSSQNFVCVPISSEAFAELVNRYQTRAGLVVGNVVQDFLDRTHADSPPSPKTGLYWERLYLPSGTELRTKYKEDYKYAKINGDRAVFQGDTFSSISKLCNWMRGKTNNNAWNFMEIKRPNDTEWSKAFQLRR